MPKNILIWTLEPITRGNLIASAEESNLDPSQNFYNTQRLLGQHGEDIHEYIQDRNEVDTINADQMQRKLELEELPEAERMGIVIEMLEEIADKTDDLEKTRSPLGKFEIKDSYDEDSLYSILEN